MCFFVRYHVGCSASRGSFLQVVVDIIEQTGGLVYLVGGSLSRKTVRISKGIEPSHAGGTWGSPAQVLSKLGKTPSAPCSLVAGLLKTKLANICNIQFVIHDENLECALGLDATPILPEPIPARQCFGIGFWSMY